MGILQQLISPLLGQVKDLINAVHLDPAVKAQMEMQSAQLEAAAEQADRDLDAKLNDIAGQNIRTDSSSNDSFVRRARPFFMWIMGTAIGVNLLLFPLVNLATGRGLTPIVIDPMYITLYKVCLLGYTGARTVEKLMGKA